MNKNVTKLYVPNIGEVIRPMDSIIYVDSRGNHFSYNKVKGDFTLLNQEFDSREYYNKEQVEKRLKSLQQSPVRAYASARLSEDYKVTLPVAGKDVNQTLVFETFNTSNDELLVLAGDKKTIINKKVDDISNDILVTYDIAIKPITQGNIGNVLSGTLEVKNLKRRGITLNNHYFSLQLDDPIKPVNKVIVQEIFSGDTASIGGDILFTVFKNDFVQDVDIEVSINVTVEKLYHKYHPFIEVKDNE